MDGAFKNLAGWLISFALLAILIFGAPKALSYALGVPYPMAAIASDSMLPTKEFLIFSINY